MLFLVSVRYQYILQTFQKSGCTTLDKLFKTLHFDEFSGENIVYEHPMGGEIQFSRTTSFIVKNTPLEVLSELPGFIFNQKPYKDFFKFAVVRNSYDRVISMYFNRYLGVGEPSTVRSLAGYKVNLPRLYPRSSSRELVHNKSFNSFLRHLNVSGKDWHYRKQDIYVRSDFKIDKYINLDKINEVLPELYETKFSISKNTVKKILKKKANVLPKNNYDIDIKLDEYDFKNDALNLDICKNGIPQKELMLTDKSINMIKKLYKEEIDYHKFEVN